MKSIALLLFVCLTAAAQSFEVASVKVSASSGLRGQIKGGPGSSDPGQISYLGVTLKMLLTRAFAAERYQVSGPAWLEEQRYDVIAKLPPQTTKAELANMLRTLLEERFALVAHREQRVLPIYALVVAKDGPKLKTTKKDPTDENAKADDDKPVTTVGLGGDGYLKMPPGYRGTMIGMIVAGKHFMRFKGESMTEFAKVLTDETDRPVIDMTELKEKYDFATVWEMDPTNPMLAGLTTLPLTGTLNDPSPIVFAALPAQLGLKLEPRKAPVDIVVVDRVERVPAEN